MYRFIVVKRNNEPQALAGKQKLFEAAGRYRQAGVARAISGLPTCFSNYPAAMVVQPVTMACIAFVKESKPVGKCRLP